MLKITCLQVFEILRISDVVSLFLYNLHFEILIDTLKMKTCCIQFDAPVLLYLFLLDVVITVEERAEMC